MSKIIDTVTAICESCTSCYRKTCPRGDMSKANIIDIPSVGSDKSCPLSTLKVKKSVKKIVSEADTWDVCRKCKFTEDGEIAPDAYFMHCLDCPVEMAREGIQECSAEASVS